MAARLPIDDQALALLYHTRAATLFCTEDGDPSASVPTGLDSRRVLPLRSAAFRDWVTANYYAEYEMAPSAAAYRSALQTLEARARYGESRPQRVDLRIGFEGDPFLPSKIILDLVNASSELVEITADGWRITDNLGHSFRHSGSTLALPRPLESSAPSHEALDRAAKLFGLDESARPRILAWLAAAMRPTGPYPILVIHGPAGSGKSVLARALRAILDPSSAPVRRLPESDHEVVQLALENWMLVFDQVHRVPPNIADALSAVSSGDSLDIARPIVLAAPSDEAEQAWAPPRSFSSRTLAVDLQPMAWQRSEADLWSEFQSLRPALAAALADTVSTALRRIRDIDLGHIARFPDGAAWVAAAAPALGLTESAAVAALTDPDAIWTGVNPLRDAVHRLLDSGSVWTGEPAALLHRLRAIAPLAALPATPRALAQALSGVPGIELVAGKGLRGEAILTVTRAGGEPKQVAGVRI